MYRLREVREEYNDINADIGEQITLKYMASLCNVSLAKLSRIETGKAEPTADILIKYADTFKVPMDYLLGCSNAKDVKNCTISSELGLSDNAIKTLKEIKSFSDNDLLAVVNAFIGSNEYTVQYFFNLLNNLVSEHASSKIDYKASGIKPEVLEMRNNRLIEQMIANDTINYIKWVVELQLTKVIEDCYKKREELEALAESCRQQEIEEMESQIEE